MTNNWLPGFISVTDIASQFNVTPRTVKNWCIKGNLSGAVKLTPRAPWLIPDSALEGFEPPKAGRPRGS